MIRWFFSETGLSLAELILVAAISSIVGILLISIFVQNNSLFNSQQAKTTQGVSLNDAFSKINADIRSATAVVSAYPVGSPQYTTDANTLVLSLPATDANGNALTSISDYVVIAKDSQNPKILREHIFPDATSYRGSSNRILAQDLAQITFVYLDSNKNPIAPTSASIINFTINLSTTFGDKQQQSSSSGQVSLRNN